MSLESKDIYFDYFHQLRYCDSQRSKRRNLASLLYFSREDTTRGDATRRGVILNAVFEITRLIRVPRARFTGSVAEFNLDLVGFARSRVKGVEFRNSFRSRRKKD